MAADPLTITKFGFRKRETELRHHAYRKAYLKISNLLESTLFFSWSKALYDYKNLKKILTAIKDACTDFEFRLNVAAYMVGSKLGDKLTACGRHMQLGTTSTSFIDDRSRRTVNGKEDEKRGVLNRTNTIFIWCMTCVYSHLDASEGFNLYCAAASVEFGLRVGHQSPCLQMRASAAACELLRE